MAAYVIVEVDVHDEAEYEDYKKLTPGSIAAYDGKFLIREARLLHWKATGSLRELYCSNFLLCKEHTNGGILKVMRLQKQFGSAPPLQG